MNIPKTFRDMSPQEVTAWLLDHVIDKPRDSYVYTLPFVHPSWLDPITLLLNATEEFEWNGAPKRMTAIWLLLYKLPEIISEEMLGSWLSIQKNEDGKRTDIPTRFLICKN